MTLSPKKYVSSYTTCTAHRGVEAKDGELTDAHLDLTTSNSSQFHAESSGGQPSSEAPPPPPPSHRAEPAPDDTPSYLQVVVEKHRRRREVGAAGAAGAARLPSASSPLARARGLRAGGDRGVYVLPHSVLLACPTTSPLCQALQAHNYYTRGALVDAGTSAAAPAPDERGAGEPPPPAAPDLQKRNKSWKIFRDLDNDLYDNEPERVEVYYFEQGAGAFLATCDGGRDTCVERAARRPARAAQALLAELLAAPALLLRAPLALLLAAQRAALLLARGAATAAVQTASDYAFKPALALLYNALLQPLLVFACNVARGVRAALRPLAAALGDALEPAVRLLAAVRLVDVRLACPHCAHHDHRAQM